MRPQWSAVDVRTGITIADLPEVTGKISHILGASTTSSLTLSIPTSRRDPARIDEADWVAATWPRRVAIVASVEDVPLWAGIVVQRQGGGTAGTLSLSCIDAEGYLDRRIVGDHVWIDADQSSTIAAGLLGDALTEGLPMDLSCAATGVLRDRSYADRDDATVCSRLRELADVESGIEWTVDVVARAGGSGIRWLARTASTIGRVNTPVVTFDSIPVLSTQGTSNAVYQLTEDWSAEHGANHVVATSSGEGDARPQSAPARSAALLRGEDIRWERRWSPSSSITEQATLDAHARAELARVQDGAEIWAVSVRANADPRLGVGWFLGDLATAELIGHRHPDGVQVTRRVLGWEWDTASGVITPKLLGEE